LPSVEQVRNRIEQVEPLEAKTCFQASLLLGSRIGEIVSLASKGDSTYQKRKPLGFQLTVTQETYTPNITKPEEYLPIVAYAMQEGKNLTIHEVAQIREPVAIFTLGTLKRGWIEIPQQHGKAYGGFERKIALPLNPAYEPWTQPLYAYFKERIDQGKPIFPFNRQKIWMLARQTFNGWHYRIAGYVRKKADGTKKRVPEHYKPFGDHALRHLCDENLENNYGFTGKDKSAYLGWTQRTVGETASSASERYRTIRWQSYFPKLLKKRQQL